MSTILDRAIAHAGAGSVRRIEVPEWGMDGAPLVITYSLVSLEDLSLVRTMDNSDDFNLNAARIVALKALDETGAKLFKVTDATELRQKAAPEVVKRIAIAMLGRMSIEDAAKN